MADNQQAPPLANLMDDLAQKMAKIIAELKREHQAELRALRSEIRQLRAQLVDVETTSRLCLARTWDDLTAVLSAHEAKSPPEGRMSNPFKLTPVEIAEFFGESKGSDSQAQENKAPAPDSSKESLEKSSK
ncbi:hypothetical protein RHGRI_007915 [Rhododendron griersonianum]|uniref:Uncharacterized protein n=1 Tax=Rhododendron griersonianum TaxID=479676 RepID=A0AAV6KZH2_9ERIC|nr:hypothetical protein RHGRI_007915 [Rhododendron griersonianum]